MEFVALGHCSLITTEEDVDGAQPVEDERGEVVCLMAGRLDNYSEVRKDLIERKYAVRSASDAELVLYSYKQWGLSAIEHLTGDFAIALWDQRARTLLLVRDHFGAKPLFYHCDGRIFCFASEVQSILSLPWVPKELDDEGLSDLITGEGDDISKTHWKGVMRLAPAHRLIISSVGATTSRYWSPDLTGTEKHRTQQDFVEHYRTVLFDAVQRHSRTNGVLSCEVSGGLDSSGVFAVTSSLRRQGRLAATRLQGFTLRFKEGGAADEIEYARAVAAFHSEPLREVAPTLWSEREYYTYARDFGLPPPWPNGAMHHDLHEAAHSSGSRVLLTGVGGDEWLPGSGARYADFVQECDWQAVAELMKFEAREHGWVQTCWALFRTGMLPLTPEYVKVLFRPSFHLMKKELRRPILPPLGPRVLSKADRSGNGQMHDEHNVRRYGQRRHLSILKRRQTLISRETMEHLAALAGIEQRSPLFSLPVVKFSIATAAGRKERGSIDRALHREALRGLLPEVVRTRRSKAEFSAIFRNTLSSFGPHDPWATRLVHEGWATQSQLNELFHELGRERNNALAEFRLWRLFSVAALATSSFL